MDAEHHRAHALVHRDRRVNGLGRDVIGIAGFQQDILLPVLPVRRRSLQHVDEFLARVVMARQGGAGPHLDVGYDHFQTVIDHERFAHDIGQARRGEGGVGVRAIRIMGESGGGRETKRGGEHDSHRNVPFRAVETHRF